MDATARLAGHAVIEIGTHVEILGEQGWWPATITWREEGSGGRLVWIVHEPGIKIARAGTCSFYFESAFVVNRINFRLPGF